ncbi:hypothetical protein B566_EDAN018765, partial [Ephemera danica]
MAEIALLNNPNVGLEKPKHNIKYVNELTTLNLGPTHPATHGIFENILTMDGETIIDAEQTVGYIHPIYEIYEEMCGARLTTNMGRFGGMERDLSAEAIRKIKNVIDNFPKALREFEGLVKRNRIFVDRTVNVGAISAERALNYGFTGPNLRATGVDYDVRAMNPYSSYEDFDFEIPVGTKGDTYDRFL